MSPPRPAPPLVACLLALALLALSAHARAAVERFAVIIGNDRGAPGDADLRYAEADAQRMYDTLKDLGHFAPANMVLLRGESATTIERTVIAVNDRVRTAVSQPDTQAVLFLYYSGHADAASLHAGPTPLELKLLEQLVRSSAADFRVLVLDACRSGALTRVKGGRPGPSFALTLDEGLEGQGVAFLTASAANEDAQESDELKASFFTHYFQSALVGTGDADGDGRVTLEEAYRYAHDNTVRATGRTWAGIQHPTFRYELRGRGKIVLSDLSGRVATGAALAFPPGRNYLVLKDGRAGTVVGEVSEATTARRLFVKPGVYFVQGRAPDHLLEGEIKVAPGQSLEVADGALRRVAYARLVRKGGSAREAVAGPLVGYTARTALANGRGLCHGAFVGYPVAFESLSVTPRVHGCLGGFANELVRASSDEAGVDVKLSHAWDLPAVTLDLGVAGGASLLRQSFESRGLAPPRTSAAGVLGVHVGATFDLTAGFYLSAELGAQTYLYRQREVPDRQSLRPSLALRQSLGLGMMW